MRKIYFFIGLLSANLTLAQIQSQDFEAATLPAGWTTNIVSGGVDWAFGTGTMPSGASFTTNAAIFDDDAAGEDELDNTVQLLSPVVNLTSYATVNLSFEYAIQDYIGAGYFTAEVWNGTTWIEILNNSVDTDPSVFAMDVTAYINAQFQVRFTYGDDQDWAWGAGVDNFELTGVLGVNSFQQPKAVVYPNPTTDFVNINSNTEITNIKVSDINGKVIGTFDNGTNKIDVSQLNAGIYFLTYDTDGNHYTNKIVRK